MPRQANGNYLAPANTAAVSGNSISSTAFNTLETDIGTEITNSLDRQGRSAMQANLPMGGFVITGSGAPVNPTDVPTKAYVDAAIWSTGDLKPTLKTVADAGWVLFDDGTIGSAGSGSSSRANADCQALFNLLFNNVSDSWCPLLTSGGGATTRAGQTNAATAWAANCRMSLPKALGRAMGVAGGGAGLSGRALAQTVGEENHLLTNVELPSHTHTGTTGTESAAHTHAYSTGTPGSQKPNGSGTQPFDSTASSGTTGTQNQNHTHNFTTDAFGGGGTHNNMQPTFFVSVMVKL